MKRKKLFIALLVILLMFILLITYCYITKRNSEISSEKKDIKDEMIINIAKAKEEIIEDEESKDVTEENVTKDEINMIEETKEISDNSEVTQEEENKLTINNTSDKKENTNNISITNITEQEDTSQKVIEDKKNEIASESNTQTEETTNDNNEVVTENEQEEQSKEEIKQEETQDKTEIVEKSIYDYEFDIEKIKTELISIGQGMGLTHITEDEGVVKNPNNSSWSDPVRASSAFQGKKLERALKDYVSSMPILIKAYGGGDIKTFTIYVENNGNGNYTFYFLY